MTNTMTKILLALLALVTLTGAASAQQRTFYDASGKVVGRSATDSQGTTTNYDSRGRNVGHDEPLAMKTNPQKITFGEMRESGLIYCRDHRCSHHVETNFQR